MALENFLPPSGPASSETIEEHLRVGSRWIRAAQQANPGLSPEDALVAMQLQGEPLDTSSIGRYRADLRYALIESMTLSSRMADFDAAWAKVDAALRGRRRGTKKPGQRKHDKGRDSEDRKTSAKKVEDATEEEARALFAELKRHAIKFGNPNAVLAALFVLVAGHAGFRPVELRGARLEGTKLTLINAKKRPGLHQPSRTIDLSGLHEHVIIGMGLLLDLIDHDLTKREFAKWQKVLAEQMRRACQRIGIRVLCLYSFRHIAVASWSAAGLPPEEIARLCGHISIRTAHTHYARGGVGHRRKAVARATASPKSTMLHELAPTKPGALDPEAAARPGLRVRPFRFEEMPQPALKPTSSTGAMQPDEVLQHFEGLLGRRDPDAIVENLRRAQAARYRRDSEQRGAAAEPDA